MSRAQFASACRLWLNRYGTVIANRTTVGCLLVVGGWLGIDAEFIGADANHQIALVAAELLDAVAVTGAGADDRADDGGADHDACYCPLTFANGGDGCQRAGAYAGNDGAEDALVVAGSEAETCCQSEQTHEND